MADVEKNLLIEDFENIQICSFSKRGLGSEMIKDLNQNGIQIIGDLKGKNLTQLSRRRREYLGKSLGEILCVIGIEMGIESSYFLNYPFMSQYEEELNKMRLNPLYIPLECLPMNINIGRKLGKIGLKTIGDLIGKEYNDAKPRGIGNALGKELEEALRMHNVTVIDGKFHYNSRKDEYLVYAETGEPSDKSEQATDSIADAQLRQFLRLSREVADLPPEAIDKVNAAISNIIKEYGGRGDDVNV